MTTKFISPKHFLKILLPLALFAGSAHASVTFNTTDGFTGSFIEESSATQTAFAVDVSTTA